jgi:competence protein ComEC
MQKMKIKEIFLKTLIILTLTGIFVVTSNIMLRHDGKLHIIFCDVGQGDGIIIKTPGGSEIIIDAGYDSRMLQCLEKNIPLFDRTIELALITHMHADHIAGFIPIAKKYRIASMVKNSIDYKTPEVEELTQVITQKKINTTELWQSDSINTDQVQIDILWPTSHTWNRANGNWQAYLNDFNDSSIISLVTYKNFQCLLTGDAGITVLDSVIQSEQFKQKLRPDTHKILKYSHHGSKDGLSLSLLQIFSNHIAIISAGEKNKYGHPDQGTLDALTRYNFQIYRTDKQGTQHFVTDGTTLWRHKN